MAFRSETLTVLPALFLFVISSYIAFYTTQVIDPSARQGLTILALSLFVGGLVLTLHWGYYWIISKRFRENKGNDVSRIPSFGQLIGISLMTLGVITLIWVGQLVWHDITVWNKGISLILFGSRTGENISLGIGMRVIHYSLIALSLIVLGSVVLFRARKCPHYFGYYASQPKKDSIQRRCLICSKVAECVSGIAQKPKPSTKPTAKKKKGSPKCLHNFGYLRSLPDSQAVPNECTACQKLLECRNLI